jgi:ankyrin repeat protein
MDEKNKWPNPDQIPLRGDINAFVCAAGEGQVEKVRAFMQRYPFHVNALCRDNADLQYDGHTALCAAAMNNSLTALKFLIAGGAKVDGQNKNGMTPLMSATLENRVEAATLLIKAGADFDLRNKDNETAGDLANSYSREIADLISNARLERAEAARKKAAEIEREQERQRSPKLQRDLPVRQPLKLGPG